MSTTVGKSVPRVDAYDKVTGRTKYYETGCLPGHCTSGSNILRLPTAS